MIGVAFLLTKKVFDLSFLQKVGRSLDIVILIGPRGLLLVISNDFQSHVYGGVGAAVK